LRHYYCDVFQRGAAVVVHRVAVAVGAVVDGARGDGLLNSVVDEMAVAVDDVYYFASTLVLVIADGAAWLERHAHYFVVAVVESPAVHVSLASLEMGKGFVFDIFEVNYHIFPV